MKVVYIKDFTGHKKNDVINTDNGTAQFLIDKGVCEIYIDKQSKEKNILITQKDVIVKEQKTSDKKQSAKTGKRGRKPIKK